MGYAVELYFDSQTEDAVRALRQILRNEGILPTLQDLDERPHVSLAVLPAANRELLVSATKEHAADTVEFDLQLSAIGTFPTEENVLFCRRYAQSNFRAVIVISIAAWPNSSWCPCLIISLETGSRIVRWR